MRPRILNCLLVAFVLLPSAVRAQGFHGLHSVDGTDVWAVGDGGVYYRSFDGGLTWTQGTISDKPLRAVAVHGFDVIAAGDSGKVWHSTDSGRSWALSVAAGAPQLRALARPSATMSYLVGAGGVILKTSNGGANWAPQNSGTSSALNAVRFTDETHGWAVGVSGTVVRTSNGGASWTPVSVGTTSELFSVDAKGSTIWVVGADGTARRSLNGGSSWEAVNLKLDAHADVRAVWLVSEAEVYLGGGGGFIRRSVDGGETWDFVKHQLQAPISAFHFVGGRGWACSNKNRALLTAATDSTWDLPATTVVSRVWQQKQSFSGAIRGSTISMNPVHKNTLYAVLGAMLYRSRDDGETWTTVGTGIPQCTKTNSFIVSARDSNVMVAAVSGSISKRLVHSDDGGQSWFTTLTHDFGEYGIPIEIDPDRPDTMFFGGDSDGLFRSTDAGKNWTEISNVSFRSPCDIVAVPDTSGVILVGDGITNSGQAQFFKSTDGGLTFTLKATRPVGASEIPGMASSRLRNAVTFGTNWGSGGVQRSPDFGETWPGVATVNSAWGVDVSRDDPNCMIFGVYSGGITYLSLDGGNTYTTAGLSNSNYSFFIRDRATIFAEQGNGIWKLAITYAYTPASTQAIAVTSPDADEVWLGNTSRVITWTSQNVAVARIEYRRNTSDPWQFVAEVPGYQKAYAWNVPSDLTTEAQVRIRDAWDSNPEATSGAFTIGAGPLAVGGPPSAEFGLWQNQPNPFTRMTRIRYALPVPSSVSLEVFDLAGHRVATLVREAQGAGEHHVTFGPGVSTATGERVGALPAGVYFYRFQAGDFARTRKMLVLE